MSPDEIRTKIEKKHRDRLEQFKKTVMDDANLIDSREAQVALQPTRTGHLKSVTNRFADVTILGDRHTLAHATSAPGLPGYRVSMSIAGHHRLMGGPTPISVEETDAWLYAAYGDEWADHSYKFRSPLGGSTSGTTYYMLYLSEDLQPMPVPDAEAEALRGALIQPGAFG